MKNVKEVALEVIQGKWGVNDDRIVRLTNAGYNASEVQREVNRILKESMITEEPKQVQETKQIMEITVDLKKVGALILNFVE